MKLYPKTHKRRLLMLAALFSLVMLLGGCFGGGGGDDDTNAGGDDPTIDTPNSVTAIAAQNANSDPVDPGADLQANMDASFGAAAQDPVDVLSDDTFETFSNRAAAAL